MKINNTTSLSRIQQADHQPKAKNTDKASSQSVSPSVVAHIGQAVSDSTYDINGARVNQLQQAIKDGQLTVNAEKIADSLIESVKDLLISEPS